MTTKKKVELNFVLKVVRNAFILAGLMFVASFSTGTLDWELCKPVIVFFLGYIFTELARHYGITTKKNKETTLIFM